MSEVKAEEVTKAAEQAYREGRRDGYNEAVKEAYDEGYADGLSDRDYDEVLRRAVRSAGLDPHRDFIGRWDPAERRWFFRQEAESDAPDS